MSFKQEKTPKPDPRLPQKINQTRFGFMASSVSMSESVFSDSLIRLMLCLKKFSHKTPRNSNINTLQRKQSNEFYLGTMLPSCQRMRFAMRINRLQLLQHSLLPGDFVLHIPLPPHPTAAAHHQHLGAEKPLMCRQGAV